MTSASGQTTIILNGEIYNYRALARDHGLIGLRSDTDTEVALEIIETIGIEAACRQFNGMWGMVVYDRRAGKVYLSRDRFGKKPLNWLHHRGNFYVASEVKTFIGLPGFDPRPNPVVVARYLAQSLQNIDQQTWLQGVEALPAASLGVVDVNAPENGIVRTWRYWVPDLTETDGRPQDYIAEVRQTLSDATALRLHADVRAGVSLSGGIDSSTLAAIAHREAPDTALFSVVHPGARDDESRFVDILSRHLKTTVNAFTYRPTTGSDVLDAVSTCNYANDGPISSLSTMLFYKLMELARGMGVTVILTGQGGDEIFCGYRKYPPLELIRLVKNWRVLAGARFLAGYVLRGTMLPNFVWAEAKRFWGASNSNFMGEVAASVAKKEALSSFRGSIAERQLLDIERYTIPYLCHYEDRMAMASSIEVRSPYLDYRLVELALRMPTPLKMQGGWSRYVQRRAFEHILPPEIAWRKDAKGFVNPEADWFRGPVKDHVLDLMQDPGNPVYELGFVDRGRFLEAFGHFCQGSRSVWFRDIFGPISLTLWLNTIRERTAPSRPDLLAQ